MQRAKTMPWKPEYSENRRRREAKNPELREKRIDSAKASQEKNMDARKEYLAKYYMENPEKYKRSKEKNAKRNEARRKRYAQDEEYRERVKSQVKRSTMRNPGSRRNGRLKSAYGIDATDHADLMAIQGGRCAICGYSDMSNTKMFPVVDHCHTTGAIRGILCSNCNQGIGKFKDNPKLLFAAIAYLSRNS